MVTVITSKEELTTPMKNGLTGVGPNDHERSSQFIKDYQEVIMESLSIERSKDMYFYLLKVDFHRLQSCKPLPEDLFGRLDGHISTSSVRN